MFVSSSTFRSGLPAGRELTRTQPARIRRCALSRLAARPRRASSESSRVLTLPHFLFRAGVIGGEVALRGCQRERAGQIGNHPELLVGLDMQVEHDDQTGQQPAIKEQISAAAYADQVRDPGGLFEEPDEIQ